jgi:hypothetical protein
MDAQVSQRNEGARWGKKASKRLGSFRFHCCKSKTYHGSELLSRMHASEHALPISFASNETEVHGCGDLHDCIVRVCAGNVSDIRIAKAEDCCAWCLCPLQ